MPTVTSVDMGLLAILIIVLIGPFLWKVIEQNLEAFLFIMGIIAATIAGVWSLALVEDAIIQPILQGIVPIVLVAGIAFYYGRASIARWMKHLQRRMSFKVLVFVIVVGLGLLSSVITAIIAALLLVELVHHMPLDRRNRVELVIVSCFSIGFGAVLTPMGEPLSVIVINALKGAPYYADFFFLLRNLGIYVVPGLIFFGILGVLIVDGKPHKLLKMISLAEEDAKATRQKAKKKDEKDDVPETMKDVLVRVLKVYIFVMALIFLGKGMGALVVKYFTLVPAMGLYWLNMVSAVLDNATLAAAEVGPALTIVQIKGALMGLLISGGMLIPGNIPNIITAQKLRIKSREWARVGVPLGLLAMLFYFAWLYFIPFP